MKDLAKAIQFTNVAAEMTRDQLVAHCETVLEYQFDAAMIAPCWMSRSRTFCAWPGTHENN